MRQETFSHDDHPRGKWSKSECEKAAPWAAVIVRAENGWRAFESVRDYEIWKNQK